MLGDVNYGNRAVLTLDAHLPSASILRFVHTKCINRALAALLALMMELLQDAGRD